MFFQKQCWHATEVPTIRFISLTKKKYNYSLAQSIIDGSDKGTEVHWWESIQKLQ